MVTSWGCPKVLPVTKLREGFFEKNNPISLYLSQFLGWGQYTSLPFDKLEQEGLLEKNKLIIKVEIKVVEVVDEEELTGKEMLDFNGFPILYTQVCL